MFIPKLNVAIPSPPFAIIEIDCVTISGIFTPHLQEIYAWAIKIDERMSCLIAYTNLIMIAYLKCMLAQIRLNNVAWVLGLAKSFLPTVNRIDFMFLGFLVLSSPPSSSFDCASLGASISSSNQNQTNKFLQMLEYITIIWNKNRSNAFVSYFLTYCLRLELFAWSCSSISDQKYVD